MCNVGSLLPHPIHIIIYKMLRNIPPVTKNLLIINCLAFFAQYVFEQRGFDFSHYAGLHYVLAPDFRPWQLLTYMFLHGNLTHLLFNMFSLWMFGRIIEGVLGSRRFLIYYLVCGIGAGLCQELWQTGEYFLSGLANYDWVNMGSGLMTKAAYLNLWTTIGASGACYGILLAYGMAFPNERIMLLIPPIPMKAKYFVAGYAAIELFSAFTSDGNIAHFAHLGGMLFGWLLLTYWRNHGRTGYGGASWGRPSLWQRFTDKCKGAFRKKPRMKVSAGGRNFKDRGEDYDFNARKAEREQRVDKILEKIKRSGYESLTDEEKRDLFEGSRK